ncbi:CHAT domain-containing protein [Actinomadura graeca]|uniref:CHAT domain-containing protein n=1 Tax=Actinomadura graeca TaxID=2750812 RepID=A0ABX8R3Z9_9ACTN|nr:CHAT domain-containing protein [Actinomadura graeca]QXJ25760.1 CHAT domain-containing protein [Actinomadura graeca]
MPEIFLRVEQYIGPQRWRWVLTKFDGRLLADHEVRLDASHWQYQAFGDLRGYLREHASPVRRIEHEAQIVSDVGAWLGEQALGPIGRALAREGPATVCVIVPPQAAELAHRPLELAHAAGRPLALQGLTLVNQVDDPVRSTDRALFAKYSGRGQHDPKVEIGRRLRVLGLFSLPIESRPLDLRRERQAMVRAFEHLARVDGRSVDLRMLQYGVTRARLLQALCEPEGWDLVHVAGHGLPGELLLETEDGNVDPVRADSLAGLLELTKRRLKLVTLSTCWSAAPMAAEQRRLLGLPPSSAGTAEAELSRQAWPAASLAVELVGRLDCAVLAMRYPVVDEFAINLTGQLYGLMAGQGQPLPQALGLALKSAVADRSTPGLSALTLATPALFGHRAATLRLPAAAGPGTGCARGIASGSWVSDGKPTLAAPPPPPERLVGRVAVMARASMALTAQSGTTTVLLQGMPGGGKSACARELAHTHEDVFDKTVWYQVPDDSAVVVTEALNGFIDALSMLFPTSDGKAIHESPDRLAEWLRALVEQHRILIILDGLETLLTPSGQWYDLGWQLTIDALAGHSGAGRTILTSRRIPDGLNPRVMVEAVDALTLDEALLLARELPHLQALITGTADGLTATDARDLALQVLVQTQGHPLLLELANSQAANAQQLLSRLNASAQEWTLTRGRPTTFLATGKTLVGPEDYLQVLQHWTNAATGDLTDGDRELWWLLCCLQEFDRNQAFLAEVTKETRHLSPDSPSGLREGLNALAFRGLITIEPSTHEYVEAYKVHPALATAGRAEAGESFRETVDSAAGALWFAVFRELRDQESKSGGSRAIVQAGESGISYLIRGRNWEPAAQLVQHVLLRDHSVQTRQRILPQLRRIAESLIATERHLAVLRVMAMALSDSDPAEAERLLRRTQKRALRQSDYGIAALVTADLVEFARLDGRVGEAHTLFASLREYRWRAGSGPWARLMDEVQGARLLLQEDKPEVALVVVKSLLEQMATTPRPAPSASDSAIPWGVHESALGLGVEICLLAGRWQQALDLNTDHVASKVARGAPWTEIARTTFDNYGPLLQLDRMSEAWSTLNQCRSTFEEDNDLEMVGLVLSAQADIKQRQGLIQEAIKLEHDALHYKYKAGPQFRAADADVIATSHHNLGYYLLLGSTDWVRAATHYLTAALLFTLTESPERLQVIDKVTGIFRLHTPAQTGIRPISLPPTIDQLCRVIDEQHGTDLGNLLAVLAPSPSHLQQHWDWLIGHAQKS